MSLEQDYDRAERALSDHAGSCATCTAQTNKVTQCDEWDRLNSAYQDAGRAVEAAQRAQRAPEGL